MKRLLVVVLLLVGCAAGALADEVRLPAETQTVQAQAFYGDAALTDVTLPEGLLRIESEAFAGTGLTVVTLPSTLTFIAENAFDADVRFRVTENTYAEAWAGDRVAVDTVWPEGLTWETVTEEGTAWAVITGYTGAETALVLPDRTPDGIVVREIRDGAFQKKRIVSVVMPGGLTVIDENAFSGCVDLESVELPVTLTSIGKDAFSSCENLADISFARGLQIIGEGAFNGCRSLVRVDIPDTVTFIGPSAFFGCEGLMTVNLPAELTDVGHMAFADCDGLREVTLCAELDTTNVFNGDDYIRLIHYLSGENGCIPAWTVSNTQRLEFVCAESLEMVDIGEGITAIGDEYLNSESFQRLTTVHLPETLRTIGVNAFANLSSLKTVNFPDGLESIGSGAFSGCGQLLKPELPESVQIGAGVFEGCLEPREPEE